VPCKRCTGSDPFRLIRLVEYGEDLDPALVGVSPHFGDGGGREAVLLHEDLLRGDVHLTHDGVCGATFGGKVHSDAGWGEGLRRMPYAP